MIPMSINRTGIAPRHNPMIPLALPIAGFLLVIESETMPRMIAVSPEINERIASSPTNILASLDGRLVATIKKTSNKFTALPMPTKSAAFETPPPPPPGVGP
jgi:hypothetical protein